VAAKGDGRGGQAVLLRADAGHDAGESRAPRGRPAGSTASASGRRSIGDAAIFESSPDPCARFSGFARTNVHRQTGSIYVSASGLRSCCSLAFSVGIVFSVSRDSVSRCLHIDLQCSFSAPKFMFRAGCLMGQTVQRVPFHRLTRRQRAMKMVKWCVPTTSW